MVGAVWTNAWPASISMGFCGEARGVFIGQPTFSSTPDLFKFLFRLAPSYLISISQAAFQGLETSSVGQVGEVSGIRDENSH